MTGRLTMMAPAKVNLYLAVGERRPDGYHEVETVMQALELHDTVTIEPAGALTVTCEPGLGIGPEENLAAVAARELATELGREPSFAVRIRKRVPSAGGLGGGSSDAAAVLAGLARHWGLSRDDERVVSVARRLGADVRFFLLEGGCALLGGKGDEVLRALPAPRLSVLLVGPGVPVSTAAAYSAFDREPAPPGDVNAMLAAIESGDDVRVAAALYDNLTDAAVAVAPEVADALAWVAGAPGVMGSCLSGSGSTVFGLCVDGEAAAVAAEAARERGWWAEATSTRAAGVREEDSEGVA